MGRNVRMMATALICSFIIACLFLSITAAAALAATSPTPGAGIATVTGKVTDAGMGTPISGAEVIFVPVDLDRNYPPATTDSSGTFTTPVRIPLGNYNVTVKASGYDQKTITIYVGKEIQQIDQPITLARTPPPNGKPQQSINPPMTSQVPPQPSPTATSPVTATPTASSPLDAWLNLLYSPQACCTSVAMGLGAIVSVTIIYEWTMRQRERRKQT